MHLLFFIHFGIASALLLDLSASVYSGKKFLQDNQFDYIIVGGGTAGLALARRLSDEPTNKVLVLEAGRSGVNDSLVTVPQKSFSFIGTDIDWSYNTVPQVHAAGQGINLSSGKVDSGLTGHWRVLGGDSAVNGLVWSRPYKTDWDDVEKLGNPGWNWDNMYAAAQKSETVNIPEPCFTEQFGYNVDPASHGHRGPVETSFPPFVPPQHLKLINASIELGHPFNLDPYSGDNTGVWFTLSSQTSRNSRETSEFAYFDPVLSRDNLVVCSFALVTRLHFSDATREGGEDLVKSTGVQVRLPDGSNTSVNVKTSSPTDSGGEVILSAGSIRTPQLLELSGIGNKNILQNLNISVVVDLPGVGENYEDHTLTILTYKLNPKFLSFDALGYNQTLATEQQELYDSERLGWLTFAQAVLNFEPVQTILNESELENAKRLLKNKPNAMPQNMFEIIKNKILSGVPQAEYLLFNSFSGGLVKEPNTSYVSMGVTHLHPLSRGSIHINTTSIDDHPIINPNVLDAEWDMWFMTKATAYGRRFFETEAFKEVFDSEVFPGLGTQTEEEWTKFVKESVNIGYHSVGTASLLPRKLQANGYGGVVDPEMKVYGTKNLRVVDSSIMPLLVSAHTQTTAYVIAEMAADLIFNRKKDSTSRLLE